MIHAVTVSVPAGTVVEVFTALGFDMPRRRTVTLSSDASHKGSLQLAQDAEGTSLSIRIPQSWPDPRPPFQFVTDGDPVYVKNTSPEDLDLLVLLTAAV